MDGYQSRFCHSLRTVFSHDRIGFDIYPFLNSSDPYSVTEWNRYIITPWGDYVAVPFGNTIWVGTVEEWMDIKADSVMRENGAKRVTLPGDKKNERSYVDSEAKSVS